MKVNLASQGSIVRNVFLQGSLRMEAKIFAR